MELPGVLYEAGISTASLPVCAAEYRDGDFVELKNVAGRYAAYVSAFMVSWITD